MTQQKILILGAGIAGLSVAISLKNAGFNYSICEAAPEIKPVGAGLGLGANAIKGFQYLNLDQEVMKASKLLSAFTIYDEQGKKISKTNTGNISRKYDIDNFAIHRAALHEILLKHAGAENVQLSKRAVSMDHHQDGVTVHFSDNTSENTDFLIVAEGINSAIRQQLCPGSEPRYAGYTCWRAVISNPIEVEPFETWGKKGRFGVVPLSADQVYWFACVNAKENDPVTRSWTTSDLAQNFKGYHAPIPSIIEQTANDQLIWNDIVDIKPIKKYAYGNVLLTGDAAHATTPNMGQGACQAIEDAACLAQLLKTRNNLPEVFQQFEQERLKRTHWVINRSRSIGKVAQASNPIFTKVRNALFRSIPERFNEKQLEFLYNVEF